MISRVMLGFASKEAAQAMAKVHNVQAAVQSRAKATIAKTSITLEIMQAKATMALARVRVVGKEAAEGAQWTFKNPRAAADATKERAVVAGARAREIASDPAVQ